MCQSINPCFCPPYRNATKVLWKKIHWHLEQYLCFCYSRFSTTEPALGFSVISWFRAVVKRCRELSSQSGTEAKAWCCTKLTDSREPVRKEFRFGEQQLFQREEPGDSPLPRLPSSSLLLSLAIAPCRGLAEAEPSGKLWRTQLTGPAARLGAKQGSGHCASPSLTGGAFSHTHQGPCTQERARL